MNSIFVIEPYQVGNTWAFDDEQRGLFKEPFVGGMNLLIHRILVNKFGESKDKFILFFSDLPFPDFDFFLIKGHDLNQGSFYRLSQFNLEGWLCPAIRKYYPDNLPEFIYFKIEDFKF